MILNTRVLSLSSQVRTFQSLIHAPECGHSHLHSQSKLLEKIRGTFPSIQLVSMSHRLFPFFIKIRHSHSSDEFRVLKDSIGHCITIDRKDADPDCFRIQFNNVFDMQTVERCVCHIQNRSLTSVRSTSYQHDRSSAVPPAVLKRDFPQTFIVRDRNGHIRRRKSLPDLSTLI